MYSGMSSCTFLNLVFLEIGLFYFKIYCSILYVNLLSFGFAKWGSIDGADLIYLIISTFSCTSVGLTLSQLRSKPRIASGVLLFQKYFLMMCQSYSKRPIHAVMFSPLVGFLFLRSASSCASVYDLCKMQKFLLAGAFGGFFDFLIFIKY